MSTRPELGEDLPEELPASPFPGEHWTIDLLTWGLQVFGEPIDGLLRELFDLGGRAVFAGQTWLPDLDTLSHRAYDGTATVMELQTLEAHLRRLLDTWREATPRPVDPRRRRWWPVRALGGTDRVRLGRAPDPGPSGAET